jgi:diaminobutyrate-2-oxoglutarate transaminase
MDMSIFERRESNIRSYCRSFPTVFTKAKGAMLEDEAGNRYIDFFAGAGSLNYGHNDNDLIDALIEYLRNDGILHSLDMYTKAKHDFLQCFEESILDPRGLNYKIQFPGPTGTNAVEAALKLARLVTNRRNIISFTKAYHGNTLGALAATGNAQFRNERFIARLDVSFLPYDGYLGGTVDTAEYLRKVLIDSNSGIDMPAAVILETVQAEGGINVASDIWLQSVASICREFGILMIVDDIQVGNGRTGPFFSFERTGVQPDIVTLSKSISGVGTPMAMVLLKPELDQWSPAEHTGTFRGNNLGFIAGSRAIQKFWKNDLLQKETEKKSEILKERLITFRNNFSELNADVRGKGLIFGLDIESPEYAKQIAKRCFELGLVIERAGSLDNVLKFLPPLTITVNELEEGLKIVEQSIKDVLSQQ